MPLLPVEEEGRLNDPVLRENFFERVFAYCRLRKFFATSWSMGDLVRFHTAEKMLLLSHDQQKYRKLGRLVAGGRSIDRDQLSQAYQSLFMTALNRKTKPAVHCNVLHHILGYFKSRMSRLQKIELIGLLEDFRRQITPLVVPLTLVRHYVDLFEIDYFNSRRI